MFFLLASSNSQQPRRFLFVSAKKHLRVFTLRIFHSLHKTFIFNPHPILVRFNVFLLGNDGDTFFKHHQHHHHRQLEKYLVAIYSLFACILKRSWMCLYLLCLKRDPIHPPEGKKVFRVGKAFLLTFVVSYLLFRAIVQKF